MDKESSRIIDDLQLQLDRTASKLEIEQAFVAGVRKIPVDIFVEIFKQLLGDDIPPDVRTLARKQLDTGFEAAVSNRRNTPISPRC